VLLLLQAIARVRPLQVSVLCKVAPSLKDPEPKLFGAMQVLLLDAMLRPPLFVSVLASEVCSELPRSRFSFVRSKSYYRASSSTTWTHPRQDQTHALVVHSFRKPGRDPEFDFQARHKAKHFDPFSDLTAGPLSSATSGATAAAPTQSSPRQYCSVPCVSHCGGSALGGKSLTFFFGFVKMAGYV
jgi:hypothetical protein